MKKVLVQSLIFFMLICFSPLIKGETVTMIFGQGTIELLSMANTNYLMTATIINKKYQGQSVQLLIDDEVKKTFSMNKKNQKYAIFATLEQFLLEKGDHQIETRLSSNWLSVPTTAAIAWEEDGRDMPNYIQSIRLSVENFIKAKSYDGGMFGISTAKVLKVILINRLAYIQNIEKNVEIEIEKLEEKNAQMEADIVTCQQIIDENTKLIETEEANKKQLEKQLWAAKELLAKLESQPNPNPEAIAQVKQQIVTLETSIKESVKTIEKYHEEIYECESVIAENKKLIATNQQIIEDLNKMISMATEEIPLRIEDINNVDNLLALEPLVKKLKKKDTDTSTSSGDDDDDDDSDFGEIFAIATIPALAIALPAAIGGGIAYTEITKERCQEAQKEQNSGDSKVNVTEQQIPTIHKNETYIRNAGQNSINIR